MARPKYNLKYAMHYLSQLGYDKFENRVYLAYGNGTETNYSYEPTRRRLHNIVATTSAGRKMMDNIYTYDAVNNITKLKSTAPIPEGNLNGGRFEYNYHYDDLYRLVGADGLYESANDKHRYSLDMSYTTTGSIVTKEQVHERLGAEDVDWATQHKTTYTYDYKYEGTKPHAPSQIGDNIYTYDDNGNQTGWESSKTGQRRQLLWDEENRLRALAELRSLRSNRRHHKIKSICRQNGQTHHYIYDAAGERVIKSTGDGQAVYVNGFPMGGSGTVGNYTMYVNPFIVVSNMKFTKHYYIEGQRIVSKLGEMGSYQYLLNPKDTTAGGDVIDWSTKQGNQKDQLIANFNALGLDGVVFTTGKSGKIPYGQIKKYFKGGSTIVSSGSTKTPIPQGKVEDLQFYYHPDHLGSSSYITDASGEVYQHNEYFPFGETFVEERHGNERTPYLFNGKELDEETGLYFFGARYLDPRISMWYGVDLMAEKYPEISPYNYVSNNPLNKIDPDGNDEYGFDENSGKLSLVQKNKNEFDRINVGTFGSDGKFNFNSGDNASFIDVSKGILQGDFFDDISKSGIVFSGGNLAEGLKTMEFLSFKSNIEFNAWGYESNSGIGLSISPWEGNTALKSKDFYLKSDRVGYLGEKGFKIHTHPGTKSGEGGYGKASARTDNYGEIIGGDAYGVKFNENYPHYIRGAKENGYSKYDNTGKTEFNVAIKLQNKKK